MSDQMGGHHAPADVVELTVPLRVDYAVSVRIMAASLAADVGFTVDEIDDLRLGVSEVFTLFVDRDEDPDGSVDERCFLRYVVSDGSVEVTVSRGRSDDPVELDPLATSILTSVVDEHRVSADGVTVTKRAAEAAAGLR